ncbi:MAG: molecular chaperone TorD family protein [Deltaproteobacteria bacterium]|nr:molecular chaperone TorD family protein [Deltaproteobacteria bacterium]
MTENARRDLYRILGGLLEQCPTPELLRVLAEADSLELLAQHFGRELGDGLRAMRAGLAGGEEAREAIRRDYVALFVGPRKKLAPPWESVYRSPGRLVMQEPEREVVRAFAEQRVGFEGMGQKPADHIALELQFVALLLERSAHKRAARAALRRFLDQHILQWVPAFAADVRKHAKTDLWRAAGQVLEAVCAMEAGPPSRPRLAVV